MEKEKLTIFFKDFVAKLKIALIEDFEEMKVSIGSETMYACALVTDSDAITVYFAVNTEEKINEKLSKLTSTKGEDYSLRNKAYYSWTPAEWAYGDDLSTLKSISKVSRLLYDIESNTTDKQLYEQSFYEALTEVFLQITKEGYFEGVAKFISVSDDDRADAIENYSAKRLNNEEISEKFLKRFEK